MSGPFAKAVDEANVMAEILLYLVEESEFIPTFRPGFLLCISGWAIVSWQIEKSSVLRQRKEDHADAKGVCASMLVG
jgi:hypothetical protein